MPESKYAYDEESVKAIIEWAQTTQLPKEVMLSEAERGRKINCVMRRFFPSSSVGDRPAPRGCTSTPDERKVTTI